MARMLFGSALATAAGANAAPAHRPNIVFVLVDDQRWDTLGCAGHPFLKTPNADRLAGEGAMFRNFFVTTPLCSPSRASFLTGQYVHRHGVVGNGDSSELSHRLITWPRLLHDAGYESAFMGKWHMGNDPTPRSGFDHWIAFAGQGRYQDVPLNVDGKMVDNKGYTTDVLNNYAVEFLKRRHDKPFALYLAHKAIHGPFTPAERHKNLYTTEKLPRRPDYYDDLKGKPVLTRLVDGSPAVQAGRDHDQLIRNQMRTQMAIDDGVGMILKTLEQTGQLDNTIIAYSSDNGYFWGEHHLGDKRWSYEESIRDPFLIRYPKLIKAGTKIDQSMLNIDVAPTMLQLAGAPVPSAIQGRSVVPLLKGQTSNWRTSFLMEYFAEKKYNRCPSWQGVRSERWKYTHYANLEGMDELYDIQADPYEMKNRINDPAAASALNQMKQELQRLLKETA